MSMMRSCLLCIVFGLASAPVNAQDENRDTPQDVDHDMPSAVLGPTWNIFTHAGATNHGRFLLQSAPGGGTGQRVLRGSGGYNVGGGAGVDFLMRMELRLSYTYGRTDLAFRTDNGDDSELLDANDLGRLQSHVASVELIRYLLPTRASLAPYASAGVLGAWWVLDDETASFSSADDTQFRLGAIGSIGLRINLSDQLALRMEAATASVRNPFTGRASYRVASGTTIDEPTRVSKSDIRLVAMYSFGKPDAPDRPSARRASGRR